MSQAVASTLSSWTGGYTLSSLWSSSAALDSAAGDGACEPASPCSPGPEPRSSDEDDISFGNPDDDALWPRFRAVWAGEEDITRAAAVRRWQHHKRWRVDKGMDSVLGRPQRHFHFLKSVYPHAFHGHAKDGSVLHLERGDKFAALVNSATAAGLTAADAAMHTACLNEFLAAQLDARPYPGGRVVRIVDCSDLSLWEMSSSAIVSYARGFGGVIGPHYPERSSKIFVVNTPASFAAVFALVSGVFTRRLLDKVAVFSIADQEAAAAALREVIDPEHLPAQYGGTCVCPGGCFAGAAEERQLWALVEAATPADQRLAVPQPPAAADTGTA